VRNPLAGKKAKFLYRNPDKSTVLQVEDEHDEILLTVEEDGTMHEERWCGVAGVRESLLAASPFNPMGPMRVPDDAGRKVWTRLEGGVSETRRSCCRGFKGPIHRKSLCCRSAPQCCPDPAVRHGRVPHPHPV
jgi:hypothetical protein